MFEYLQPAPLNFRWLCQSKDSLPLQQMFPLAFGIVLFCSLKARTSSSIICYRFCIVKLSAIQMTFHFTAQSLYFSSSIILNPLTIEFERHPSEQLVQRRKKTVLGSSNMHKHVEFTQYLSYDKHDGHLLVLGLSP